MIHKDFIVKSKFSFDYLFSSYLDSCAIGFSVKKETPYSIFIIDNCSIAFHLVPLEHSLTPGQLRQLQEKYKEENYHLIHLWEDIWFHKNSQVKSRIRSLLGSNHRIYARNTQVVKISKPEAEHFLNENHLQGFVSSKYKLGLYYKEELMAVATFSALRKMNHTEGYQSVELIRFAVRTGYSIVGGFSKLLKYFIELKSPNDIMTYADMDWSDGAVYESLGFKCVGEMAPKGYDLIANGDRQINLIEPEDAAVFNTGSLKYILTYDK